MESISIRELAAALGCVCGDERRIERITTDSREAAPGCVFVCVEGERFDGHDFAAAAVEAGAAYVVARRRVPVPKDRVFYVDNTLSANIALAGACRRRYSPLAVGITGSVGKTTTKEFTAAVLSERYRVLKTPGNRNNEIGVPETLRALDGSYTALVAEMGMNASGDIDKLSRAVAPDIGVVTWIGTSHIELLGSRENILRAKLEIVGGMKDGAPLILCADNDLLRGVSPARVRAVYYGIENRNADIRAADIARDGGETLFTIEAEGKRYPARIPAFGAHNVLDALAAFAVGREAGMDPDSILRGLASYESTGLRQRVSECGGVTLVEDCYNASPDSMAAALRAFAGMEVGGRRVAALGDMLELGGTSVEAHRFVGSRAAEEGIDTLYAVGQYAGELVDAARAAGLADARAFGSKEELGAALCQAAKPGDAVWFKASRGVRLEETAEALRAYLTA